VRHRAAILLVIVLAGLLALTAGCASKKNPIEVGANLDRAKDVAAKAGLLSIQMGVQSYVATSGAVPSDASQTTLGSFVSPWPNNPFTKVPMALGTGVGDYSYAAVGATGYKLTVKLSDGSLYSLP
jgi:hypothetical protein